MTTANFPIDPASMPALKHWLASQAGASLRTVDIDEILIDPDALLQLPAVLRRAGIHTGRQILLVMDETPMRREQQDLKPLVQALLHDAGYQVASLWLKCYQSRLDHAGYYQVYIVL